MKYLLLFTLILYSFSLINFNEFQNIKKQLDLLSKEQVNILLKNSRDISKNNIKSNIKSGLFSTVTNPCNSVSIITECNQLTEEERRNCITEAYVCNQFKKQPIAFLFNNSTKLAFSNNQVTFQFTNDTLNTNIFFNNAGYFTTYNLITYIIDNIQPLTYVRLFPFTFNNEEEEYKEEGSQRIRKRMKILQTFVTETCTNGIYTSGSCSSGLTTISIVMFVNYHYYDEDYRTIKYIYCQEVDNIPDSDTSSYLTSLNDDDFQTKTKEYICNKAQNKVLSQYDFYLGSSHITNQIRQLCSTTTGTTGTFGRNGVGRDGYSLGISSY